MTSQEKRAEWLAEHRMVEMDVLDDDGEYIMVQNESDHSDGYQIDFQRVDLPKFEDDEEIKYPEAFISEQE